MDTISIKSITEQLGPVAAIIVVVGWFVLKAVNKVTDRFLAGYDKNTQALESLGSKIEKHSEADAAVVERLGRLEGKIDAYLDQAERFTPVGVPLPTPAGMHSNPFGPDEVTPPVRHIRHRTPPGVAAGYRPPGRPPRDDGEG